MATESERDISMMVEIMGQTIEDAQTSLTSPEARELAGKVLCPIFDFVKPAAYVEAMTIARQKYAGIADSPQLQTMFTGAVENMANLGWLDSLAAAVQNNAWSGL